MINQLSRFKFMAMVAMIAALAFVIAGPVPNGFAAESVVTVGGSHSTKPLADFITNGQLTDGKVWYVDSGMSANGNGTAWSSAFSTLDAAFTSNTGVAAGDIIYIAPGHAENLAAADAVDVDIASVRIIGLGEGANRPTFTYTATAGEFVIGAANVTIEDIRFVPGISDVVMAISVEAAGDQFTLSNCEFGTPGTATFEFLDSIDIAALADNVTIQNCVYRDGATSAANHFIEAGAGVNTGLRVTDNDIQGRFAVSAIWSNKADTGAYIARNVILNSITGQHAIEFTSTATGMIVYNALYGDTEAAILDPGSTYIAGNILSTAIDNEGIPLWVLNNGLDHVEYWQEKTVSVSVDEVTADLFDIDGGPILVKAFWGVVDVLIGANATTCTIQADRDDGAADNELSTAVNIETDVLGTVYVFSNANPSVLTPLTSGAAGGGTTLGAQWIVPEGMLEQAMSADPGGAASDHITWYMTYVPLTTGITVTAQ